MAIKSLLILKIKIGLKMKISKKEYARLTLPWRCMLEWPLFNKAFDEYFEHTTTCNVTFLRVIYPIAWPIVVICVPIIWVLMLGFLITTCPLYVCFLLYGTVAKHIKEYCKDIDFTESVK